MEFKTKRLITFILIGIYLFLGGCEFAIIFPTAWEYIQTLGATDESWIGFIISAYSLSACIAGIIGGRLSDKYESCTKMLVNISVVAMIVGSFQYSLGINLWNVLVSRVICGIGTAAGAAMMAQACRVTDKKERTTIMAVYAAARQLGVLFGPVFQLGLQLMNFDIGNIFTVTPLNAPGIFMGFAWIVYLGFTTFFYFELTDEDAYQEVLKKEILSNYGFGCGSRRSSIGTMDHHPDLIPSHNYQNESLKSDTPTVSDIITRKRSYSERFFDSLGKIRINDSTNLDFGSTAIGQGDCSFKYNKTGGYELYKNEFISDKFVILVSMAFALCFCHVSIETVIPVVTETFFGYGVVENSLIYMLGGFESLVLFFGMAFMSKYIRDTTLILIGWIVLICAEIWLMVSLYFFVQGQTDEMHFVFYITGIVILYLGYPIASISNSGLFSKSISLETQGLGFGIRRCGTYLGLIFGPTWGGSTVQKPVISFGVPIFILVVHLVMFSFSLPELRSIEKKAEDEDCKSLISSSS